jgi:formylglycine-generating enzyme required for sulfatase activity
MSDACLRFVPEGTFLMGSDRHYPEEGPARTVRVDPFWMDETPVTVAQFAQFVEQTGYVTFAEIPPDPQSYPGITPEMIQPGSLLFVKPSRPIATTDYTQWWTFSFGTSWRHPQGPESGIDDLMDHPVTHIAYADAKAYADWTGKMLPTEVQWEFAARSGLDDTDYAWGDELLPEGQMLANFWQGEFPWRLTQGHGTTSPVRTFAANAYGLFDMIGNVWEWTSDWFTPRKTEAPKAPCCIPSNPRGGIETESYDPCTPGIRIGRKVLKGGSHLCAPNYCRRYRPAARYPQPVDTSTSHVGFRCIMPA